ncbi:MAG: EVE domain-containing protein [Verrucomicrobia bacterium]|nr:EVE domain-containing protein [Verrucomicrobiota bacterium]MDE3098890.1 EVE domain-containing protein [Verrucomicrobiota bacterium]
MNYWLVKSEPDAYSWTQFLKEGKTAWTGVRNFQARNHLRAMKRGDAVLFYHSVSEQQMVGVARVEREHYPDPASGPSERKGDWSCVDLTAEKTLARPVTLESIKADPLLRQMALVKQSRLSVTPLTKAQFQWILQLAGTKTK